MERELYRGDDYVIRRQVFHIELVDLSYEVPEGEDPHPFDMAGCSIRTTFKETPTDLLDDPDDEGAPVKGEIIFDESGTVSTATLLSLPPGRQAQHGELYLTMPKTATAQLPPDTPLSGDIQVTDTNGEDSTIPVLWTLVGRDGYTNRSGGTP
jgi:hypothetical protein